MTFLSCDCGFDCVWPNLHGFRSDCDFSSGTSIWNRISIAIWNAIGNGIWNRTFDSGCDYDASCDFWSDCDYGFRT